MEKAGFITVVQMGMRDGINPRLLKRHVVGGIVRSRGNTHCKVRYEAGKLQYGTEYIIVDNSVLVREDIRFIRGKFISEEVVCSE